MNSTTDKRKHSEGFDLQRKIVSHATTTSWQNIPHVSYVYEPDITDFHNELSNLAKEHNTPESRISFNTIMLKVIAEGLLSAPELNSHLEYNFKTGTGTTHCFDEINISIPWLLPDGKMIPITIPGVDRMSLREISDSISKISKRIEKTDFNELQIKIITADTINQIKKLNFSVIRRIIAAKLGKIRIRGLSGKEKEKYYQIPESERLTEKDIVSATVTVSNIGSLYKEQRGFFSLLEIISPQVFVVGIGSIQERPGVYLLPSGVKEIGIRKILPMCLAFDHRAFDFSAIVPFLKKLDDIFAKPNIIYKW